MYTSHVVSITPANEPPCLSLILEETLPVYAKTNNLMAKRKSWISTYDYACARMYYVSSRNSIVYLSVYRALPNGFFTFSKARFSKRLERFCSTLLLHTATMVETSRMPCFSFWNECYRFAQNSKFHSATKDREMNERVEMSRRKYSRRRVCSQDVASLVAKV